MTQAEAIFMFGFVAALLLLAAAVCFRAFGGGEPVKINTGDKVKDKLSGAEGIVVSRTEWLYGCVRLQVQAEETKDGKPVEPFVIDEAQAEVVRAQALPDSRPAERVPHGDRLEIQRAAEPTRA